MTKQLDDLHAELRVGRWAAGLAMQNPQDRRSLKLVPHWQLKRNLTEQCDSSEFKAACIEHAKLLSEYRKLTPAILVYLAWHIDDELSKQVPCKLDELYMQMVTEFHAQQEVRPHRLADSISGAAEFVEQLWKLQMAHQNTAEPALPE
jgi:uncharacterized protein YeaC (DUF1315 family)